MSLVLEERAATGLLALGLEMAHERLDTVAQQAAAHQWSYRHFLGQLLADEINARHDRTVEMNMRFAGFPVVKQLAEFDFKAQPSIDPRLIDELASGRYLQEGRNIVFLGPPGTGKSHLATALGIRCAHQEHRVYFTSAMEMARRLARAMADNRLHHEMRNYLRPRALIIDEVGYLKMEPAEASLLFQVIAKRYDNRSSILLTSNKPFAEWAEVFAGDAIMASAALDRLLHLATVINIRGESYRLRERRLAGSQDLPNNKPKEASAQNR